MDWNQLAVVHRLLTSLEQPKDLGSALNLNIHYHMLFLDGVYVDDVNCEAGQCFMPVSNHAAGGQIFTYSEIENNYLPLGLNQ